MGRFLIMWSQKMRGRRGALVLAGVLFGVFVWELAIGAAGDEAALLRVGALKTIGWSGADWWRVLTYSFLHFNWAHLAMNLVALLWLGGLVERRIGVARVAIIYIVSAVTAAAAGMLLGPFLPTTGSAVGASGAIFGLLPAALVLAFRRRDAERVSTGRHLRTPLMIFLAIAAGTSWIRGVSIAGHLGGFVGGALASPRT